MKKVILITGASSGIGWAAALALAREGHVLALAARRRDRLEDLARRIEALGRGPALVIPADVRRTEEAETMVRRAADRFGRLDVLINNAGLLRMEPFLRMPPADMEDLFHTNFWGPVSAIRHAAPLMARAGGGHVINVGSGVSRRGLPFMAAYSATKFALAGLTESIRLELAEQNIAFTMIYPGGVDTEMPRTVDRAKLPPDYPDHARWRIPSERVARAVVKAVRRRPLEIYVPWWVRVGAWISVLWPAAADRLVGSRRTRIASLDATPTGSPGGN
jgi:NAD(P)-dependent dehydrogenase (short-subunit alcohol dehydrogenase family)